MYILQVIDGPLKGRQLEISSAPLYIGRDQNQCPLALADEKSSRVHARLLLLPDGKLLIEDNNSTNGVFVNGQKISRSAIISPADTVVIGSTSLRFQVVQGASAPGEKQGQAALNLMDGKTFRPMSNASRAVAIAQQAITIGREATNDIVLNHPMVSRTHARILFENGNHVLHDLGSTNGTYVNGHRVIRPVLLPPGSLLSIANFRYFFDGNTLLEYDQGYGQVKIEVQHLGKTVTTPEKTSKELLRDINLVIEPREFVALLGGSGAGKSTLMGALTGMKPASQGQILINGSSLYDEYDSFRSMIGYVPQDDIVHSELTVTEVLTYSARLRMPDDTRQEEIEATVDEVISELELHNQRDTLVKSLSGGQRKRVSIGVELLTKPSLFFLDEPTSGLDPGLEKVMMELMRKLANQGRTIILVTHATFNIKLCDKVVFLTRGGKLAFFGTPAEAEAYFKADDFADIYKKIETECSPDEWQRMYLGSPYFQRHVLSKLDRRLPSSMPQARGAEQAQAQPEHGAFRQWRILTARYGAIMWRDKRNLLMLLMQSIVISLLLVMIFPHSGNDKLFKDRDFSWEDVDTAITEEMQEDLNRGDKTFGEIDQELDERAANKTDETEHRLKMSLCIALMVFVAIWLGASNSAREIIKEDAIYRRERLVNLKITPYIMSKLTVLTLISIVQQIIFVGIISLGLALPSFFTNLWAFLIISLASILMGLAVSAIVSNQEKAMTTVPLLLIPQILLSGAIVSIADVTEMIPVAKPIFWLAISKWGYELVGGSIVDVNNLVRLSEWKWFEGQFIGHWLMLFLFIGAFYALIVWALLRKDRSID